MQSYDSEDINEEQNEDNNQKTTKAYHAFQIVSTQSSFDRAQENLIKGGDRTNAKSSKQAP